MSVGSTEIFYKTDIGKRHWNV